jgi:hypothetical protein
MLGSKEELMEFEDYVDREMCEFLIGLQNRINNKIEKDELTFSGTIEDYMDESELNNIKTLQGELYKQTLSYCVAKNRTQREAPAILSTYIKYVQVCVESDWAEGQMGGSNGQYH